MLPLDLHVLSLSLAFILSQDQTLRCSNCFMSLLKIPLFFQVQVFFDGIHSKYLYYCCICKFLKELFAIVSFETWCKGKDFYFYLPNFFEVFFRFIFSEVSFGTTSGHSLGSSNLIPRFLSFQVSYPLFHHVCTASLSIAGAKVLL